MGYWDDIKRAAEGLKEPEEPQDPVKRGMAAYWEDVKEEALQGWSEPITPDQMARRAETPQVKDSTIPDPVPQPQPQLEEIPMAEGDPSADELAAQGTSVHGDEKWKELDSLANLALMGEEIDMLQAAHLIFPEGPPPEMMPELYRGGTPPPEPEPVDVIRSHELPEDMPKLSELTEDELAQSYIKEDWEEDASAYIPPPFAVRAERMWGELEEAVDQGTKDTTEGMLRGMESAWSGMLAGTGTFIDYLDEVATVVAQAIALPDEDFNQMRIKIFREWADFYLEEGEEFTPQNLAEKILFDIGAAPGMLLQFFMTPGGIITTEGIKHRARAIKAGETDEAKLAMQTLQGLGFGALIHNLLKPLAPLSMKMRMTGGAMIGGAMDPTGDPIRNGIAFALLNMPGPVRGVPIMELYRPRTDIERPQKGPKFDLEKEEGKPTPEELDKKREEMVGERRADEFQEPESPAEAQKRMAEMIERMDMFVAKKGLSEELRGGEEAREETYEALADEIHKLQEYIDKEKAEKEPEAPKAEPEAPTPAEAEPEKEPEVEVEPETKPAVPEKEPKEPAPEPKPKPKEEPAPEPEKPELTTEDRIEGHFKANFGIGKAELEKEIGGWDKGDAKAEITGAEVDPAGISTIKVRYKVPKTQRPPRPKQVERDLYEYFEHTLDILPDAINFDVTVERTEPVGPKPLPPRKDIEVPKLTGKEAKKALNDILKRRRGSIGEKADEINAMVDSLSPEELFSLRNDMRAMNRWETLGWEPLPKSYHKDAKLLSKTIWNHLEKRAKELGWKDYGQEYEGEVHPPTEKGIGDALEDAKIGGEPSTPEMKAQILSEINAALKEFKDTGEKELDKPPLIINVPGDGVFEVPYKKEVMESFKQILSQKWPGKAPLKSKAPRMPSMKATGKRIGGEVTYFNPYGEVQTGKLNIGTSKDYDMGEKYIETDKWIGSGKFMILKSIVGDKKIGTKGKQRDVDYSDQRVEDLVKGGEGAESEVTGRAISNRGYKGDKPLVVVTSDVELGTFEADTFDWIQNQVGPDADLSIKDGTAVWRDAETGDLLAMQGGYTPDMGDFFHIVDNPRFQEIMGVPAGQVRHRMEKETGREEIRRKHEEQGKRIEEFDAEGEEFETDEDVSEYLARRGDVYEDVRQDTLRQGERGYGEGYGESQDLLSVPWSHETGRLGPKAVATMRERTRMERLKFWKKPKLTQRHKMLQYLAKKLKVPIRTGKYKGRTTLGIYKVAPRVIRLKRALDYEVAIHEIAHHVERLMGMGGLRYGKEVTKLAYQRARSKSREGFAEFLRIWVTDYELSKELAPEFVERWENALENYPEIQQVLRDARQYWNEYLDSTSVHRWKSFVVSGKDAQSRRRTNWNIIRMELIDELFPIRMVEKMYEMQEKVKVSPSKSPYLMSWLLRGSHRTADQWIKLARTLKGKEGIEFDGESLYEIVHPILRQGRDGDLDAWLAANAVLAHHGSLKGLTGITSRAELELVARQLIEKNPDFTQVQERLIKYQEALLEYMARSGRISREFKDLLVKRNENVFYTPLHRISEMARESAETRLSRRKIGDIGMPKSLRKRTGEKGYPIISPLESLIYNTYEMINIADRNKAAVLLAEMVEQTEGAGRLMEKIPFPVKKTVTLRQQDVQRIIQTYGKWIEHTTTKESTRELEETIKELGEFDEEIEIGKDAKKMKKVVMEALTSRGWAKGEAENIISFLGKGMKDVDKGKETDTEKVKMRKQVIEKTIERVVFTETFKEWGVFLPPEGVPIFRTAHVAKGPNEIIVWKNGKPTLYELDPILARAVKSLDPVAMNMLSQTSKFFTKMFRRTTTTLSIKFGIRNPLRDQFTAYVQSRYGTYVPFKDLVVGLGHMMGKTDTYKKYVAMGAAHASLISMDRPKIAKNMRRLLREPSIIKSGRILNPYHAAGLLIDFVEAMEEGTRVGGFAKSLKYLEATKENMGFEPKDMDNLVLAAIEARDMTLDFSRAGMTGKMLNMHIAFWNPTVQGYDKALRTMFERVPETGKMKMNNKMLMRAVMGITVPTIINWMINKDDPEYHDLEPWRRTLFWNIKIKGEWYMIPKPFEWGIMFATLPEMILDSTFYNDPKQTIAALEQVLKTQFPGIMPTIAIPPIEVLANKDLFFDRPVISRSVEGLLPERQYGPYTSETVKKVAGLIRKIPGMEKTWLGTPAQLEHLITGYTSSFGRNLLYLTDQLLEGVGLVEIGPQKSFARDVMEELGMKARYPSAHSWAIEKFYDQYEQMQRVYRTVRVVIREETHMSPLEQLQTGKSPEMQYFDMMASYMTMTRKMIKHIWALPESTLSQDDKARYIDTLYIAMGNMARSAIGTYQNHQAGIYDPDKAPYDWDKWKLPKNLDTLNRMIRKGLREAGKATEKKKEAVK